MKSSVVRAFLKLTDLSDDFAPIADRVFDDLILLLSHVHKRQKDDSSYRFSFTQELELLDQMWHAFILHTKYYSEYCHERFGEIIHHLPETDEPNERSEEEKQKTIDLIENQIHDLKRSIGKDFANRIYFVYPKILQLKDAKYVE